MTKPKILVSRRWPEAVETAMKEKYDVTFNISDKLSLVPPNIKE